MTSCQSWSWFGRRGRWGRALAVAVLWFALGGCFVGARGRVATGARRTEAVPAVAIAAPTSAGALKIVATTHEFMFGYGVPLEARGDHLLIPYAGGLWRYDEAELTADDGAFGVELGVSTIVSRFIIGVGLQQTFGDLGTTGGFLELGVIPPDICGCGFSLD